MGSRSVMYVPYVGPLQVQPYNSEVVSSNATSVVFQHRKVELIWTNKIAAATGFGLLD